MLCKKETGEGFPWQFSGWDAVILMQGVQLQAPIEELRSHMPHSIPQKMCKHFSQCLFNTRYSINVSFFFFFFFKERSRRTRRGFGNTEVEAGNRLQHFMG